MQNQDTSESPEKKPAPSLVPIQNTLRLLKEKIGQHRFIVVSNREPYIHRNIKGEIRWNQPAGGVTSALDPLLQVVRGIWVAWGSGDADRETADSQSRILVPPEHPAYTLRRVWLSPGEVETAYHGYANRFLWPLCHMILDRVVLRQRFWQGYLKVNEHFAEAILQEIEGQEGLIWIHDYHLAMCPALLKKKRPDLRVALFWHIPWPAADVFRICPQRKALLSSLLACDQIGFHLDRYRQNFMECVEQELGSQVQVKQNEVHFNNQKTTVSTFPVSIDFEFFDRMAHSPQVKKRILYLKKRYKITPDMVVGIGVDRLDYTKGLLKRLLALEEFLSKNPDLHKRFLFIQIAAPTRAESEPYRSYRNILHSKVEEINSNFGQGDWKPIEYIERQLAQDILVSYYRLANFCLVSSVYDGMNLVSKEYVASRVDESGVLVLSEMAGSLEELGEALPINPYDVEGMAKTIRTAIEMPAEEQRFRMSRMRAHIKTHNIFHWMEANLQTFAKIDR